MLIGCGGFNSSEMNFTDDIDNSMSQYNQYINDYSMTYWISKNYQKIKNPEYIGFAQYRRTLMHEDWMLQPNAIVCTVENGSSSLY